jgi:hypothetical protein
MRRCPSEKQTGFGHAIGPISSDRRERDGDRDHGRGFELELGAPDFAHVEPNDTRKEEYDHHMNDS